MSNLKVFPREIEGKKVKQLRSENKTPAVLFGPSFESKSVYLDSSEFRKVFKDAGYSNLINIDIEGDGKERVVVKEVQIHPIKDYFIHVSLYVIDKNKAITAEVPIQFTGMSPAEDLGLGFVLTPVETISISCLPDDLPSEIEVSLDVLTEVGSTITISDVALPKGVELASGTEETVAIAYVAAPQKQEVEEEDELLDEDGEPIEISEGEEATEEE